MGTDEKACEKCGSPECRGVEECIERMATNHVIELLTTRHGQEVADYWAWEMTPMPIGFPSDEQLGQGLRMAFGTKAEVDAERVKNAAEMDAAMAEADAGT